MPGDRDALTFEGTAGDEINLYVTHSLSGSLSPLYVTVYGPSGLKLASSHSDNAFEITATLPSSAQYTVIVEADGGATGNYTLYLSNLQAETGQSFSAGDVSSVSGDLAIPGDRDAVTLNGRAGDEITIYTTHNLSGSLSHLYVTVYGPSGSTLASSHSDNAFEITATLPSSARYTVIVDADGDATGNYTLYLSNLQADAEQSFSASSVSNVSGTLVVPGDRDVLTFEGTAGGGIDLYATHSLSGSLSHLYVTVYNPSGSKLTSSDSYNAFEITATLPSSGTYTVIVDADGGATGNYTLKLTRR